MVQTGIPFGEVAAVKGWLGIEGTVGVPEKVHPKRPVDGFACSRSEVSGRRLWGWAADRFKTPRRFFARFFVANYCPLAFTEVSGRNRTPDKLPLSERKPLLEACDLALRRSAAYYMPRFVVGVGAFARQRAEAVLSGLPLTIGGITHPSPANPRANRNWGTLITSELRELGIDL
jgi:single-strand selective monofunctional uracil DNA glycosylase